ncbi:hypothetical protein NM688_g4863 [Phlebia brevispora]|uniref:Uncharacterized protein n=1 Tax=Phlebia brevispora TaxID=194682 RepID=A0ACC1T299_9APHY|nr:hypothetical protein NM688_g4863 [Phlebia brevispora]
MSTLPETTTARKRSEALRQKYATLGEHEIWWRDHQQWLGEMGYMLRPRYRPGWKPSWEGKKIDASDCEDAVSLRYGALMDATRTADGKVVMLKKVVDTTHPYELEVNRLFSTEPIASHPKNHCAFVYEFLDVPGEDHVHIIVMPLLRAFNKPSFRTVGEAVDFFQQVFEGLQFMHRCHVAHRDCMDLNIMLDPYPLFPRLFHPQDTVMTLDHKALVKPYTRTRRPTKYFFIDFGLSAIYDPARGPTIDKPVLSGDKTVPEFQNDLNTPRDVYPTDVYYLGNMIRESFLQTYHGVEFMKPLVDDMVQDDPSKRPTMDEVMRRFEDVKRLISWWKLRSRLVNQDESGLSKVFRATGHAFRTIGHIATFRPAIPSIPN